MKQKIQAAIVGYGNLGKGVRKAINQSEDIELVAIFTRREPGQLEAGETGVKFEHISAVEQYKGKVDVMILCGGSATDLPEQTPAIARMFNTVDSFDTHAKIPEFFATVDAAAKQGGTLSVISTGWDPGLFSMNRLLAEAILPQGKEYTFWGKGVSQGHSDAIRRVEGVKGGVQYTVPVQEVIEAIRAGETPELTTREKHLRECFVVAETGADQERIREEIVNMPNYFADYDTTVTFITEEELAAQHSGIPHGGFVIRSGVTGEGTKQIVEFGLKLESNPEFTASVLVAYARAAQRMSQEGQSGARTVFDIPLGMLSPKSPEELRRNLL
ncbi:MULTISPECIES: diaminopimelate dehydrogenase [Paenibacillus]|uniref:diaminopimelate dehydrogenase n=1 Tax=Paenibacillus TaxID=44249 RepID=UPI00096C82EB|nr:diaminopimelate dehydrogenase [Paenibacillus odorifer]OMC67788.1 diaminopimelate dehydrogenase [Paenibacillus odorifer]OMD88297.1 diaminopimelate dehydrogenase [Paenibacillus odorifer]OMD98701.1 diaminopimelate dehydrogenase [Paenibacillus odorifer]OME03128.1 diaminopimelate dehydrogenase [Paenibacillus odorifer]